MHISPFAYLIGSLIVGGIGSAIGSRKGRTTAGFWLGFLLGIIGIIWIACLGPTDEYEDARVRRVLAMSGHLVPTAPVRACPYCAETIMQQARFCRYCGRSVGVPSSALEVPAAALPASSAAVPSAPVPDPTVRDLPPPGWYPDPTGERPHRYWDGTDWQAHPPSLFVTPSVPPRADTTRS